MKSKIFIPFICLIGCKDFTVGVIGEPEPPTVTTTKRYLTPSPIPGKGLECTTNEQCGDEFVCYKDTNSYVGVCAKISE